MASRVRNIRTKNYQNLVIVFQITVKNVGDVSISILMSIKQESVSMLVFAYVGRHFEQVYCKQLKNGHLHKMSAKVSEM